MCGGLRIDSILHSRDLLVLYINYDPDNRHIRCVSTLEHKWELAHCHEVFGADDATQ